MTCTKMSVKVVILTLMLLSLKKKILTLHFAFLHICSNGYALCTSFVLSTENNNSKNTMIHDDDMLNYDWG